MHRMPKQVSQVWVEKKNDFRSNFLIQFGPRSSNRSLFIKTILEVFEDKDWSFGAWLGSAAGKLFRHRGLSINRKNSAFRKYTKEAATISYGNSNKRKFCYNDKTKISLAERYEESSTSDSTTMPIYPKRKTLIKLGKLPDKLTFKPIAPASSSLVQERPFI